MKIQIPLKHNQKPYEMVLIEWVDSLLLPASWVCLEDLEPGHPALSYSAGFVIEETKEIVVLAHSIGEEQTVRAIVIPKCSILSQSRVCYKPFGKG